MYCTVYRVHMRSLSLGLFFVFYIILVYKKKQKTVNIFLCYLHNKTCSTTLFCYRQLHTTPAMGCNIFRGGYTTSDKVQIVKIYISICFFPPAPTVLAGGKEPHFVFFLFHFYSGDLYWIGCNKSCSTLIGHKLGAQLHYI